MKRRILLLIIFAFVLFLFVGCGDKPVNPDPNPKPDDPVVDPGKDPEPGTDDPVEIEYTLTVDKTSVSLTVGEDATITATITPTATLVWSSSDNGVATVSSGKIKAIAAGTATITVSTEDGKVKKEIKVTVSEVVHNEIEDLKSALTKTVNTYSSSDSFNVVIETNASGAKQTMQMVYNMASGSYSEFFYEVKGNVTISTYVKDGVSYMNEEGTKRKATLSAGEMAELVKDYNGKEFLAKVASFYDEEAFYNALEVVSATEFKLIPNKYNGTSLNVSNVEAITLKVTFSGEYVSKVELIYSNGNQVTVSYNGFTTQTVPAPNDLSSYTE